MLVAGGGRLRNPIAWNVAALALLCAVVLSLAYPATEAVRLRNALLIGSGERAGFEWTPERIPAGFMAERRAPTPFFAAAARAAGVDKASGDRDKALALAAVLTRSAQDKGAIQSDLESTYRAIVEEGRGYCADFIAVYLALAGAAGLTAREWGFSFDGFGGHGHAVVEIYDRQLRKWVFLDVYNNIQAVDAATREPLSALEFRDFVLGRRAAPLILPIGPGRPGYRDEGKLVEYYRNGAREWFLWLGNNVYTYDAHPVVRAAGRVSRSLEQMTAIALGVHPRMLVLASADNEPQLERMARLRLALQVMAGVGTLLAALLVVQLAALVLRRSRPEPSLHGGNHTRYAG